MAFSCLSVVGLTSTSDAQGCNGETLRCELARGFHGWSDELRWHPRRFQPKNGPTIRISDAMSIRGPNITFVFQGRWNLNGSEQSRWTSAPSRFMVSGLLGCGIGFEELAATTP